MGASSPQPARQASVAGPSGPLGTDHADEAHALAGLATEVVGQGQLAAALGDALDLALAGLLPQLGPALEQHAKARRPDGMAEALEPAVRVDRQLAVEVERPGQDLLPGEAPFGEPE